MPKGLLLFRWGVLADCGAAIGGSAEMLWGEIKKNASTYDKYRKHLRLLTHTNSVTIK